MDVIVTAIDCLLAFAAAVPGVFAAAVLGVVATMGASNAAEQYGEERGLTDHASARAGVRRTPAMVRAQCRIATA